MQRRFLYIPDFALKNGNRCREIRSETPLERGSSLLSSFLLRCAIQSDRNTCTTLHINLTLKQWTTNNKVSFPVDSVECGRYVKVFSSALSWLLLEIGVSGSNDVFYLPPDSWTARSLCFTTVTAYKAVGSLGFIIHETPNLYFTVRGISNKYECG